MNDAHNPIDLGFNPYESPKAAGPGGPIGALPFNRHAVYRSGHLRAMWTVSLLAVMIILALAKVYCDVGQCQLLDQAKHRVLNPVEARENDARVTAVAILLFVMFVLTAIPYLMWVYRAYQNLPALGARHLEHGPGMAVGWWFVPFANLVKPYTVVAEIWRNSDPAGIGQFARRSSSALVGLWWGVYIVRGLAAYPVIMMFSTAVHQHDIDGMMTVTAADAVLHVATVVAAVLAILVVLRIDKMQDERYEALQNAVPVAQVV